MFTKKSLPIAVTTGIAALCLVGAGTAGAVAGQLIDSDDIARHGVEKRNVALGAINWKRIQARTQARIEALAGEDGATGPAGPQGPAGERGPRGPQGEDGLDGEGGAEIAAVNRYFLNSMETPPPSESEIPGYPMAGQFPDIELTEPGAYLVTVHGVMGSPGVIIAGETLDELGAIVHGCIGTIPVEQFGFPLASCDSTYTIQVGEEGLDLPVWFVPLGEGGPGIGAFAEVSVLKVAGEVPDLTVPGPPPTVARKLDRLLGR